MDESYLKQYVRQQREKRTGSPAKIAPVSGVGSGVRSTQPAPTNRDSGSDSGQNPKIEHSQLAEGRFARADVQRGIDAQKSVQATRESGGRVVGAVKNQGEEVVGSIRLLGVKLTTALEENNSKLLRSIDKLTNAVRFSGGGGGLFEGPSRDRDRGRGRGRGGKPSKFGTGLKIAGGALVGGVLGHYAGAEGARMLGFDEDTAETAGTVGSVAGSVLGGVVMTEGGRKGVARAGQAIVRNPGAAGAVVAGGYAAYQGAKNVSTLTDSGADTADRIRAGSHLALSGVGGFIGSRLGGAQGAAYGAAAGDFVADAAESLGSVLNDAISGTTIGDAIQTGIGTGIDALLSPFSADARDRLGKTFGSVADSASAAAAGVVGSVSAFGRQAADVYDSAVSRVGGLTVGAGEAVMAAVGAGSQLFSEGLASSATLFQEGITSSLSPAITAAAGMISSSVVNFQNWYAGFGDTFDQLASDLGRNFDEFADGASMLARSTWAGLKAGAGKVEQAAKEGYNNAQPKPATAAAQEKPAVTTSQASATPFGSRDKPQAASAETSPVPAAQEKPVKQNVLDKAANVARGVAGAVVSGAAAVPGAAAEVKRVAAPGVQAGLTQMKSGVAGGVGSIAEFFESGGRGVNTISTGKGDHGGVSYGKHQLASKNGSMATFLKSKEAAQFSSQFAGLTPGSKEFNDAYAKLASGENSSDFAKAQKQYIDRTHFEPTKNNVTESTGIDIANRSKALNEAVYSTSVQYGAGGGSSLLKKAWKDLGPDADDATLISRLQDYKQANVDTNFKSSSADMRAGVAKRAGQEKEMLLRVLEAEKTGNFTEKETKNKWVKKQDEAIKQAAGLVPKAGSDSQVAAAAPTAGTVQPTQVAAAAPVKPTTTASATSTPATETKTKGSFVQPIVPTQVASTQREKTAQELNPHLFKQTQTTPMSPLRDTALTGSGGSQSVKVAEAAKSYHLSPLARSRSAAGNSQPSAVDSLASARPTEFEKIREKPALTQQVEIANFPEQKDEQASMQQAPAIIAGKGPPMLDEIPLIISDMGLVLLQMGHT